MSPLFQGHWLLYVCLTFKKPECVPHQSYLIPVMEVTFSFHETHSSTPFKSLSRNFHGIRDVFGTVCLKTPQMVPDYFPSDNAQPDSLKASPSTLLCCVQPNHKAVLHSAFYQTRSARLVYQSNQLTFLKQYVFTFGGRLRWICSPCWLVIVLAAD